MSQQGWTISSSDDDDCAVYVPLSKRLKQSDNKTNAVISNSDDYLPSFERSSNTCSQISTTNKENINNNRAGAVINLDDDIEVLEPKKAKKPHSNKSKIDVEKLQRKALQDHVKTLRPPECMKYMICEVSDIAIAMFNDGEIIKDMSVESEATFKTYSTDIASVRWKRKVTLTQNEAPMFNDEPVMVMIIHSDNFVQMVDSELNNHHDITLQSWTQNLESKYVDYKIQPVVFGMKEYKKRIKRKLRNKFKNNVQALSQDGQATNANRKRKDKQHGDEVVLADHQIEEAVVNLQILHNIPIRFVDNAKEFVQLIVRMTKSIGETPFKRLNFQEEAIILDIPAVKVNPNTGEGCKKVWKQMIQQFENVSPDMASAIVDRYSSIGSLLTAYSKCVTLKEKEGLLEDIIVRRGIGTIQTQRRIGPGLSKKIYRWATTNNAEEII